MGKSRSIWVVPILVALAAAIIYAASHFKIEEAARRHSVAVVWDDKYVASVRCVRFSNESDANLIESNYSADFPSEYDTMRNGDKIKITELLSGFNNSRILHQFVVAEITLTDGSTIRNSIRITPEIVNNGMIDLGSGGVKKPNDATLN